MTVLYDITLSSLHCHSVCIMFIAGERLMPSSTIAYSSSLAPSTVKTTAVVQSGAITATVPPPLGTSLHTPRHTSSFTSQGVGKPATTPTPATSHYDGLTTIPGW